MASRLLAFTLAALLSSASGTMRAAEAPVEPSKPQRKPWAASEVKLPKVGENDRLLREVDAEGFRVQLDLTEQKLRVRVSKDESWREPNELRAGDVVSVVTDSARLQDGKNSVAALRKGQRLAINRIQGEWLSTAVLDKGKPKHGWVRRADVKFVTEEPTIEPTLAGQLQSGFVSAAVLMQKAKQFDDGLYAAVELAAQSGAGDFAGKKLLLSRLARELVQQSDAAGDAGQTVLAGAMLGGLKVEMPSPLAKQVSAKISEFQGNSLRSKPIGFYTWSDPLSAIFQQDRMLQSPLGDAGIESVARALHGDAEARQVYESYLTLTSKLTNPFVATDFRPLLESLDEGQFEAPQQVQFFPASRSRETDLIKRLYGNRPIPDGFNLADELIARVQSGDVDLTPSDDSGWYDYQTWSLEPLALPERMPEAERLELNDEYRKQLLELFKGVLALARETHIKQLELAPAAAAPFDEPPKPEIYVAPQISAEPLAEMYLRRAHSYRFVHDLLRQTFGSEALRQMHRQTANGPVEKNLEEELNEIESLFHGAYATVRLELGMLPEASLPAGSADGAEADARRFLDWSANLEHDADLGQDARMMVPVFYDLQRKQTKAWVFLGWTSRSGGISYANPPAAKVLDKEGNPVDNDAVELHFVAEYRDLVYPVVAEVYVNRILNRTEFRKHCDTYKKRSVILENL